MIEDELVKIWQSSPNQERVKFEKSRLMIDVQSSLDRLHRFVKYRDLMDTMIKTEENWFFGSILKLFK